MITKICRQCEIELDISLFYKHAAKCKECILTYRKSEEFKVIARVRDRARQQTETRKSWDRERRLAKQLKFPEKYKARLIVNRYFRYRRDERPTECSHCLTDLRIELHHEDYSNPREVIPLCSLCHNQYHKWYINIDKTKIITF